MLYVPSGGPTHDMWVKGYELLYNEKIAHFYTFQFSIQHAHFPKEQYTYHALALQIAQLYVIKLQLVYIDRYTGNKN